MYWYTETARIFVSGAINAAAGGAPHWGVTVTYHPDGGLAERMSALRDQLARVVIVDNGSSTEEVDQLKQLARRNGADLVLNTENLGMAAALNQGLSWARSQGFPWVLLLDQDSEADTDLVVAYQIAYDAFPDKEKLAIIGCAYREQVGDTTLFAGRPSFSTRPWEEVIAAITSGSLLSIAAFERVGPFRQEFFIDQVDAEFCLRARSQGFRIIHAAGSALKHRLGDPVRRSFLGRSVHPSQHAPIRRYYMVRNWVVLCREYQATARGWILREGWHLVKTAAKVLLYEDRKVSNLAHMGLGLWHGLVRRMGRLD